MSPQPAAAPQTDPFAKLRAEIEAVPEEDRSPGERQFIRANLLEQERTRIMKQISSNREYLRLMDANEELSPELGEWLEDFYPLKERGEQRSEDEIERTRKAKAAARQK